jgi:hypothetical protein
MAIDLYAGIPVNDYAAALTWYERLLGSPPPFVPNDLERRAQGHLLRSRRERDRVRRRSS